MPQTFTPTGAPSIFGGVGRLEWSAGNPDDPFPLWQDITPFVRTEDNPLRITRGRQSELDQVQPSQLVCDLDNTDNRFTFGYTGGPYGATWTPARKVRYSETIGNRTFVLFTGWIEFPDVNDWQPIGYQVVQLTCTDRLTRLSRGRKFVSTLGAHIVFNGGPALQAYLPLNEQAAPVAAQFGPAAVQLKLDFHQNGFGFNPDSPQLPSITYARAAPPDGDDVATVYFANSRDSNFPHTAVYSYQLVGTLKVPVTLSAGQVLTLVAWTNVDDYNASTRFVQLSNSAGSGAVTIGFDFSPYPYQAFGNGPGWGSGVASGGPPRTGVWTPVAARIGFSPATCELWVKNDIYTASMPTAGPTTTPFDTITIGNATTGGIGHVQLYVGAPGDWDRTKFLAQVAMGFSGLEYQLTGQRVNTILDYAGVPAADRAVDPGASFMQKAKLAGLDPYTAIQNAVTTERGRGLAGGDGRFVFHDRVRILNV